MVLRNRNFRRSKNLDCKGHCLRLPICHDEKVDRAGNFSRWLILILIFFGNLYPIPFLRVLRKKRANCINVGGDGALSQNPCCRKSQTEVLPIILYDIQEPGEVLHMLHIRKVNQLALSFCGIFHNGGKSHKQIQQDLDEVFFGFRHLPKHDGQLRLHRQGHIPIWGYPLDSGSPYI